MVPNLSSYSVFSLGHDIWGVQPAVGNLLPTDFSGIQCGPVLVSGRLWISRRNDRNQTIRKPSTMSSLMLKSQAAWQKECERVIIWCKYFPNETSRKLLKVNKQAKSYEDVFRCSCLSWFMPVAVQVFLGFGFSIKTFSVMTCYGSFDDVFHF